ncbi:MAG: right-handed parallel beta-helix repeat-containing protein, partial [Planctomycetota bacterium]|nr:right-handed parallel beta-helix repeat-containing protein [Planctomycetota bacterium]
GTLRILPGALVLIDGVEDGTNGTDFNVRGKLESLGTRDRPVTFTASNPAEAWGEMDHDGEEESIYRHTILTRAGNAPEGGHTDSGATINADDTRITFEHTSITDIAGKTMDAEDSEIVMRDCLLQRSVMGPEIEGTALIFENSAIFDMRGDNDNDGIYLHDQNTGQEIRLSGCIVAGGDDDAIDTLDSDVTIEDCIVRDFADKGISLFHDDVTIRRCLVVGNDIGISCKTHDDEGANVTIDHVTVAGNRIGIESRNRDGEDEAEINYSIANSIIRPGAGEGAATIRTDYDPDFFTISYCNLGQALEGTGGGNNLVAPPAFVDETAHDFRLSPGSPCIDAGDPDSPPDPDGSRSDIGYRSYTRTAAEPIFMRGEASGDGSIDITDAVTILSYLFAGAGISCATSGDSNDDGTVDITDAIYLLTWLFSGGNQPPPPVDGCGRDPTPDNLDCREPTACP